MMTKTSFPSPRACKAGFTLVEILVVIAIIVVLAALGSIGIRKGIAKGYRTHSMSNLKQLQIANEMYASDRNGAYVAAWAFEEDGTQISKWHIDTSFLEYYRGPVDPDAPVHVRRRVEKNMLDPISYKTRHSGHKSIRKSYGLNITTLPGGRNNTPGSLRQIRRGQLKDPSRTCAFITACSSFATYSSRLAWNGEEDGGSNQKTAYRYEGRALCVYYDGHVGSVSMDDVREMDKDGGSKNIFWTGY